MHGVVKNKFDTIIRKIYNKSKGRKEAAETKYTVIERRTDFTVVEAMPLTGRTNQIRIHFKNIQHPLVGEDKFAFRKDFTLRAKRVCLHAGYLEFKHPQTGKIVVVKSPLPEDMQKFLKDHQS